MPLSTTWGLTMMLVERGLQLDGAVRRVGLGLGDEAADDRDAVLDGLQDAIATPRQRGVEGADRARRGAVVVQSDVVDVDLGLHALDVADLIARRGDRDVVVVLRHVLPQERGHRAERCGGFVLYDATDGGGHHLVASVAGIDLAADQAGSTEGEHDDDDEHDRQRVADEAGEPALRRLRLVRRTVRPEVVDPKAGSPAGDTPASAVPASAARRTAARSGCPGGVDTAEVAVERSGPRDRRGRSPQRLCPTRLSELGAVAQHGDGVAGLLDGIEVDVDEQKLRIRSRRGHHVTGGGADQAAADTRRTDGGDLVTRVGLVDGDDDAGASRVREPWPAASTARACRGQTPTTRAP